jgi:hypothetical protein
MQVSALVKLLECVAQSEAGGERGGRLCASHVGRVTFVSKHAIGAPPAGKTSSRIFQNKHSFTLNSIVRTSATPQFLAEFPIHNATQSTYNSAIGGVCCCSCVCAGKHQKHKGSQQQKPESRNRSDTASANKNNTTKRSQTGKRRERKLSRRTWFTCSASCPK